MAGGSLCCAGGLALAGIALIAGSFFVERLAEGVVRGQLAEQLGIDSPAHSRFGVWLEQEPCSPDTRIKSVWFYNLTNADQVMQGARPNVTEIGPFVYGGGRSTSNVTWNSAEGTVSYTRWISQKFCREKSVLPDDVLITSVNQAFWGVIGNPGTTGIAKDIWNLAYNTKCPLHPDSCKTFLTERERAFTTRSARDIVLGYVDPQIKYISELAKLDPKLGVQPDRFPGILPGVSIEEAARYATFTEYTRDEPAAGADTRNVRAGAAAAVQHEATFTEWDGASVPTVQATNPTLHAHATPACLSTGVA